MGLVLPEAEHAQEQHNYSENDDHRQETEQKVYGFCPVHGCKQHLFFHLRLVYRPLVP